MTDLSVRGSWEAGRETWPDLHAQEVVTVTLRGDASIPLELSGRLPDGSEHRFAVDLGTVGNEAVKVLWAKERIAALLASSRQPEAIALARQHNMICEGAGFIAWDEAEQVPIAREELVQPAQNPALVEYRRFLVCASPRSEADDTSFGDFCPEARREDVAGPVASTIPTLVTRLRETFDHIGVAAPGVKGLVVWAQSHSDVAMNRLNALCEAAELITQMRTELGAPFLRDRREPRIRQALSSSPDALLKWAGETRATFHQILALQRKLTAAETPKELVDQLVAQVLEAGTFDRDRLEKLEFFTESLDRMPFSTGSEARLWRAFLNRTVGVESKVYSIARHWLPELAGAARESSAPRPKVTRSTSHKK